MDSNNRNQAGSSWALPTDMPGAYSGGSPPQDWSSLRLPHLMNHYGQSTGNPPNVYSSFITSANTTIQDVDDGLASLPDFILAETTETKRRKPGRTRRKSKKAKGERAAQERRDEMHRQLKPTIPSLIESEQEMRAVSEVESSSSYLENGTMMGASSSSVSGASQTTENSPKNGNKGACKKYRDSKKAAHREMGAKIDKLMKSLGVLQAVVLTLVTEFRSLRALVIRNNLPLPR